ncbi:hypothetical protein C5167_018770 [Papaver somniferum]|uniref:Uncharacterized protein n=1 Tax=Papaver somniferum TaxID=3469 RepID=A0A4Y7IN80_PAPSO|nr:hypothetical protein C5167_018770 [Papaver somniferum]
MSVNQMDHGRNCRTHWKEYVDVKLCPQLNMNDIIEFRSTGYSPTVHDYVMRFTVTFSIRAPNQNHVVL